MLISDETEQRTCMYHTHTYIRTMFQIDSAGWVWSVEFKCLSQPLRLVSDWKSWHVTIIMLCCYGTLACPSVCLSVFERVKCMGTHNTVFMDGISRKHHLKVEKISPSTTNHDDVCRYVIHVCLSMYIVYTLNIHWMEQSDWSERYNHGTSMRRTYVLRLAFKANSKHFSWKHHPMYTYMYQFNEKKKNSPLFPVYALNCMHVHTRWQWYMKLYTDLWACPNRVASDRCMV